MQHFKFAAIIMIGGAMALGCRAAEDPGPLTTNSPGGKADGADSLGAFAQQSQAISEEKARDLDAVLDSAGIANTQPGSYRDLSTAPGPGKVYLHPANPLPTETVTLLVASYQPPGDCPARAEAVLTTDNWVTQQTAGARQITQQSQGYFIFELQAPAAGVELELAIRVDSCSGGSYLPNFWLNNGSGNYRFSAYPAEAIQFLGHQAARQQGLPVDAQGRVYQGHPVTVTVQTYPRTSGTEVWLHYRADTLGAMAKLPMHFDSDAAGEYGNNLRWTSELPTAELPIGAEIAYWISATDVEGNTLWVSNGGKDYPVVIVAAPAVSWAGAGKFTFSKFAKDCQTRLDPDADYYNWCYSPGLQDPFTADFSVYQAYGSWYHLGLELYLPGITDQPWSREQASTIGNEFFQVELYSDLPAQQPGGAKAGLPLTYVTRRGNNFVYDFEVYLSSGTSVAGRLADGSYSYKFRVSTDGGATWFWLGTDAGQDRTLIWNFSY